MLQNEFHRIYKVGLQAVQLFTRKTRCDAESEYESTSIQSLKHGRYSKRPSSAGATRPPRSRQRTTAGACHCTRRRRRRRGTFTTRN